MDVDEVAREQEGSPPRLHAPADIIEELNGAYPAVMILIPFEGRPRIFYRLRGNDISLFRDWIGAAWQGELAHMVALFDPDLASEEVDQ